jgi:hypothetical protein
MTRDEGQRTDDKRPVTKDVHSKRKYTVTDKVRASDRLDLEKARAVGQRGPLSPTDKRLEACRANLTKARESLARVQGAVQGIRFQLEQERPSAQRTSKWRA